ncbi:MarR family transcriptional regulator [Saccharomonospora sp. NPDC006951]
MDARERLVADIGQHYERLGLSATAARVLGVLMLEPNGRADAPALVKRLGVAKSSLSVALGTLERYGLVLRFRGPGERRESYQLADDAFEAAFLGKLPALESFLALADRGLALVQPGSPAAYRVERMRAFYAFMLREFPALMRRWHDEAPPAGPDGEARLES